MTPICPWDNYPKDPFPFCEPQLCQWIGQPANTWSNLGYFVVAYLLWKSARNHPQRLFAGVCLFLAIGSTLFHMSGTMWAKKLDVLAMLMLTGFCLSLSLTRLWNWRPHMTWSFFTILCMLSYPAIGPHHWGGTLFVLQAIITVAIEARHLRHATNPARHYLKHVLIVFPLAVGLNMLDQNGPLCWKNNHVFTVHGLWHLMSAYCIYSIAQYYRGWSGFTDGPSIKP